MAVAVTMVAGYHPTRDYDLEAVRLSLAYLSEVQVDPVWQLLASRFYQHYPLVLSPPMVSTHVYLLREGAGHR